MLSHLGGVVGTGRLTRPLAAMRRRAPERILTAIPPSWHLVAFARGCYEKHARFAGFAREDFVYG